jgi:hypothetical protein
MYARICDKKAHHIISSFNVPVSTREHKTLKLPQNGGNTAEMACKQYKAFPSFLSAE